MALSLGAESVDAVARELGALMKAKPPASFKAEPGVENLMLTASKSSGLLNGSFRNLATGLRCPVMGVVLQQQNFAAGFFTSTNAAGAFDLMPDN